MRPLIARHLLKTLGSEEFEDNHQDCSLALVTALINPVASVKVQTMGLFAAAVKDDPSLADIVIGHIEDTQSLAHQVGRDGGKRGRGWEEREYSFRHHEGWISPRKGCGPTRTTVHEEVGRR